MIGAVIRGMRSVDPAVGRRCCSILNRRAEAVRRAHPRQPVDRAGPVENAQTAFPTRALDATNASTRSTGVLRFERNEEDRKITTRHPEEDHQTTAVVASLR